MKLFLQRKVILKGKEKKMEQSKWVIVRRETGFEKIKRSIKNMFFRLFKKDKKFKKTEDKVRKSGEIVVEIIA